MTTKGLSNTGILVLLNYCLSVAIVVGVIISMLRAKYSQVEREMSVTFGQTTTYIIYEDEAAFTEFLSVEPYPLHISLYLLFVHYVLHSTAAVTSRHYL